MINEDKMERMYNFRRICEAVLHKDKAEALALFHVQAEEVFSLYKTREDVELMRIVLNSMNRSIYNFALYALEISLHKCCFLNGKRMHGCLSIADFYDAGEKIIQAYINCFVCPIPRNIHIEKAKVFIEKNLHEPLTLGDVSNHIFVSRYYLCNLFKTTLHCTFSEYLTRQRIARAKYLLLHTKKNGPDIAQQCGFSSSSYFSTVFRTHTGMPPTRFRVCYGADSIDEKDVS